MKIVKFCTLLLSTTLVLWSCSSSSSDGEIDMANIQAGADEAQKAFASGEAEQVMTCLSSDAAERYGSRLAGIDPEQLKTFGKALKKRRLTASSPMMAEFSISIEGETYVLAFALQEEGKPWKLMRF